MSSLDYKPKSVMSRGRGDGRCITGGRACKHSRAPSLRHSSWPSTKEDSVTPSSTSKRSLKLQAFKDRRNAPAKKEERVPQDGI